MTSHPARVLVVADDLTGANDCGVQFATAGWPSTLRISADDGSASGPRTPGMTAVSTDCRALPDDDAAAATTGAVEAAGLDADDHLYLKVDSTLRGSVAGQVAGALEARRTTRPDAFVVLCPAYPAMGREVRDGVLTVDGELVTASPAGRDPVTPVRHDLVTDLVPGAFPVPAPSGADPAATAAVWAATGADVLAVDGELVTASPAGRDPVTPVRHDLVTDLVPGAFPVPAPSGADPAATAAVWAATGADVLAVDARDAADLARTAAVVVSLGPRAVPAGSAGLAGPLARLWVTEGTGGTEGTKGHGTPRPVRRPLVLVSSHHATARDQVTTLLDERTDTIRVATDVAELLGEDAVPAPGGDGPVVLVSPDDRSEPGRSAQLAAALGRRTAAWLRTGAFDAVVLVGGDGAEATLRAAGAHGVRIHGRLLEGVPHGEVAGGDLDGLAVVTKAGGFGDRHTLRALLAQLDTLTTTPEDPR